ncbi:DUF805 domain-containing protein [Enterovibrio calviensis]|uniref:DUF805 domain-containing protein n=1 Tax=Enterovibrio calviensis TaxID=91359 RepID=UPI0004882621|nr:DUF805 domain-containing protein [Enterovibrio calviensis]
MKWFFLGFMKYATFYGRARRKEYFGFFLTQNAILLLCVWFDVASIGVENFNIMALKASLIWWGITLLPSLGVTIRRLHDINKSGWWMLITMIPFIGTLIFIVFLLMRGTKGHNRFGSDPRGIFSHSL